MGFFLGMVFVCFCLLVGLLVLCLVLFVWGFFVGVFCLFVVVGVFCGGYEGDVLCIVFLFQYCMKNKLINCLKVTWCPCADIVDHFNLWIGYLCR